MRIFQVLEGSTNAAVSGNQTWYRNLYEPLVEMGHDVVLSSAEDRQIGKPRVCFNAHHIHAPETIVEHFSDLE